MREGCKVVARRAAAYSREVSPSSPSSRCYDGRRRQLLQGFVADATQPHRESQFYHPPQFRADWKQPRQKAGEGKYLESRATAAATRTDLNSSAAAPHLPHRPIGHRPIDPVPSANARASCQLPVPRANARASSQLPVPMPEGEKRVEGKGDEKEKGHMQSLQLMSLLYQGVVDHRGWFSSCFADGVRIE